MSAQHRNFVRADANLKRRFRTADESELKELNDCCAICREKMDAAKVTSRDLPRTSP